MKEILEIQLLKESTLLISPTFQEFNSIFMIMTCYILHQLLEF